MAACFRRTICFLFLLLWAFPSAATAYTYLSYENITSRLVSLSKKHPNFLRLYSAQEAFSLPHVGTCAKLNGAGHVVDSPCVVWVVELTNRATLPDDSTRPELLISGEVHGDEIIGPQAVMAFLEFMIDGYSKIPLIKQLVDSRLITLIPTANAAGYFGRHRFEFQRYGGEYHGLDPNRDFAFNQDSRACMRTVTARIFNELFRRHIFRLLITFHGGTNALGYEWGDNEHCMGRNCRPAPDFYVMDRLARRMSRFAGPAGVFENAYPVGTMGKLVYPVNGGLEDWAYGASWAGEGVQCHPKTLGGYPAVRTSYTPTMTRCITYLVETGRQKAPNPVALGNSHNILTKNASGDGHVPRNVRLLLAATDAIEPYFVLPFSERESPVHKLQRKGFIFSWSVGGGFVVDGTYLQWSTKSEFGTTKVQRGKAGHKLLGENATLFTALVPLVVENNNLLKTSVSFRVAAVVDNSLYKKPNGSVPHVYPQSHLLASRSRNNWNYVLEERKIASRRVFYSKTIRIDPHSPGYIRLWIEGSRGLARSRDFPRAPSDPDTLKILYPDYVPEYTPFSFAKLAHVTSVLLWLGVFAFITAIAILLWARKCRNYRIMKSPRANARSKSLNSIDEEDHNLDVREPLYSIDDEEP